MGVGVKGDGVDLGHINFSVHHNAFIGSDIDYLTDDAASVFIVLILDEPALQTNRELVDDRSIYGFCFAGGQTAAGKFVGNLVAGLHAEIIRLDHVGSVGNADGKRSPCLDVLHGLMGFGEIHGNGVSLLHGAPCGVHHIHAAVLVISRNHQNRHRENTLSTNLKELGTDKLIVRTEYPQIPPKVEYSLSERGKSLMKVLDQLCVWGEENRLGKDMTGESAE